MKIKNQVLKMLPETLRNKLQVPDKQIDSLNSVCLFLGPYRNLTTLTASLIFLHPHAQVLNHAGARIFNSQEVDFFLHPTQKTYRSFCRFALVNSTVGTRGSYGGSITLSHAFAEHERMRETYQTRFDNDLRKDDVRSIIWKESMKTSNHLRDHAVNTADLLEQFPTLRFLMPVRNPIDCAISNRDKGTGKFMNDYHPNDPLAKIVDTVIKEMSWVIRFAAKFPDRFFIFFENEFNRNMLERLAAFLKLGADPTWVEDASKVYQIKPSYPVEPALLKSYQTSLETHFEDLPDMKSRFLELVK